MPTKQTTTTAENCEQEEGGENTVDSQSVAQNPSGGQGPNVELLMDRGHSRGDAKMLERAIKNGWPITAERRERLMVKVFDTLEYASDPRDIANLGKVVTAADSINVQREKLEKPANGSQGGSVNVNISIGNTDERRSRISAIAARLGIAGVSGESAEAGADEHSPSTGCVQDAT